jgi:hypothetical protein
MFMQVTVKMYTKIKTKCESPKIFAKRCATVCEMCA